MHPRPLPWPGIADAPPWRRGAARVLRLAAVALGHVARRIARHERQAAGAAWPLIEYHAEAGAPEGALYIDGRLVGHLPGIRRL
jgi:hypothetical protein